MKFHNLLSSRIVINPNAHPYIASSYTGPVGDTVAYTELRGNPEIIILQPEEVAGKEGAEITRREQARLTRVIKFADGLDGKLQPKSPDTRCKISQVVAEYSAYGERGKKVRAKITFTSNHAATQDPEDLGASSVKMTAETTYINGRLAESKIDIYDPKKFKNVDAVSITKLPHNDRGREIIIHRKDGNGNIHLVNSDCQTSSPTHIFLSFTDGKRVDIKMDAAAEYTELYAKLKEYSDKHGAGDVLKATKQLAGVVKKDLPVERGTPPSFS